jgi:DNA-binding response OmpR family regulator
VLVSHRFDGMDGVDLIKLIRALDHRKDVPIVMVTGTLGLDVVTTALTAGADDVLYKPIDLAILVATVSKCVDDGRHVELDGLELRKWLTPSAPADKLGTPGSDGAEVMP